MENETVVDLREVHEPTSIEQQAAHAANPAANPLPDKTVIVSPTASRLPAGSTLEVQPGLHVAHPHGEVNLPGKGDPRVGDTDAVTESMVLELPADQRVPKPLGKLTVLHDSVRPQTLVTVADADHAAGEPAKIELTK